MNVLWWLVLALFVIDVWAEITEKETGSDKWSNTANNCDGEDKHPLLPDFVVINMTIYNETVTLNLTKDNKEDYEEISVFIGGKWETEQWNHSSNEEFNVYNDKSKDTSFTLVKNKQNGKELVEYFGFFVHKQIKYSLIRKELHEKSPNPSEVVHTLTLHGLDYVVYEDNNEDEEPKSDVGTNCNDAIAPDLSDSKSSNTKQSGPSNSSSRSRRMKRAYNTDSIIDLLVIIDHSVYNKWLILSNNSRNAAIENIRYYLAHIINGVNNVYTSMQYFKLSVSVISIFICESKDQCMFTEHENVYTGRPWRINMQNALRNFNVWIATKLRNRQLPRHDIAAAFTDYHEHPTEGLAYVGTVCGYQAQGLIHEKGHYDTITITAHELGHVLGCQHDGGSCPPEQHYLMSPIMSNQKLQNRDKFSACSMNYILDKVYRLKMAGSDCLASNARASDKEEDLRSYLGGKHPGQHFGPDQQCRQKAGKGYKYCSQGKDSHLTICNQMGCVKDFRCYYGHPLALDGTFCGNNMWCMSGRCVPGNPDRHVDRTDCFYGDRPDQFPFNNVYTTCENVKNNPSYCYSLDKMCCSTCNKIKQQKNINIQGCEYGERGMQLKIGGQVQDCNAVFSSYEYCKNPNVAKYCCESCMKAKTLLPKVPSRPNVNQPYLPPVKPPRSNQYNRGGRFSSRYGG